MRAEDGYIVHKCLNGDSAAFGLLVAKYQAGVYASAYDRLQNFHDAEDVTQEVFFKAYRSLRTLRQWDSFASWLYRITLNVCKDWIRAQSRRPDHEFIEDQSQEVLDTPSENTYRQELVFRSVRETLNSLPEMYRQVLTLHYLGGMTSAEIARFVGSSPAAIRMRLSKARSLLKEEIFAMMNTTFEKRKLRATLASRTMEAIKRMKIHPPPRITGVPWGLSLAAGIILAVLSLNPHISISDTTDVPACPPSSIRGDIPVDIFAASQLSVSASEQGDRALADVNLQLEQWEMVTRHTIERTENILRQQELLLDQLRHQLNEIRRLRETLGLTRRSGPTLPDVNISRARRDFVPAIPFEDRLKEYIELPEDRELRLLDNGDFENGLVAWKIGYSSDTMNSIRTCKVVYDEELQSNVLEIERDGGGADGSAVGMSQNVFIDLSQYEEVFLELDIKPIFQSLEGGGGAGGPEYPATVQIAFIDQRGEPHVWNRGFYYKGTSVYDNATKVEQEQWFHYVSPNLKEVMPDCADQKITSDSLEWHRSRHLYKPSVIPAYITRVLIFGYGWDYKARVDNIELIMN